MAVPPKGRLTLSEAASYVAQKCEVSQNEARDALLDAFASREVEPAGTPSPTIAGARVPLEDIDWRAARIDWKISRVRSPGRVPQVWTNVDVSRNQIDKWIRSSRDEAPKVKAPGGGRPPKYDRDAFNREVVRLANTPDGLPDRARLMKHMAQWCVDTWGDQPSESLLREWMSKIYPSS
jgi:hypothetical protein